MILRNSGEKLWLTIILLAKLHLAILGQLAPKSSILLSPEVKQHCTVDSTLLCSQISALEEQLRASSLPLKVAQTRLEGRTARVRHDLVRDAPQDGLVAEVQHLTQTRTLLREKLAKAL